MLNYINVSCRHTPTVPPRQRKSAENHAENLTLVNKKRMFLQFFADCLRTQRLFLTFAASKDKRIANKIERSKDYDSNDDFGCCGSDDCPGREIGKQD